jgi:hypothetical protein
LGPICSQDEREHCDEEHEFIDKNVQQMYEFIQFCTTSEPLSRSCESPITLLLPPTRLHPAALTVRVHPAAAEPIIRVHLAAPIVRVHSAALMDRVHLLPRPGRAHSQGEGGWVGNWMKVRKFAGLLNVFYMRDSTKKIAK